MSEWKEVALQEIAEINPSERLPKGTTAKKVAMEGLQSFTKKISGYSLEDYSGGAKFRNGDTVIARITPCLENGKTAYVDILEDDEIGFGSTEFIVLRERIGRSDKQFLYYLATSPSFREIAILSMTGSSGRQRVQTDVVKEHNFLLPPLSEQRAIASILSSLDDKIDLLHCQNQTLEQMAETLFRQWFVEEAKEDGTLEDIMDINPTYKLNKETQAPYLEMGNVNSFSFSPSHWYNRKFTSGMKFMNGDTLLARITPCLENGKTCFISFLEENQVGWGSTEYIIMRMKNNYHPFISYLFAKDKDFRDFAISSMSGSSGRQRAQPNVLKEYEIFIPSADIIENLNKQCESILKKLNINAMQIRTLTGLREALLPKLMSREVSTTQPKLNEQDALQ